MTDDPNGILQGNGEETVLTRFDLSQTRTERETAALLDDIAEFLGRFIAYPDEHARTAHTLWIAHAHLMDCWESTPRLGFLSPEAASGKTRALELTELMVPNPLQAVNVTPAYLFRKVGGKPLPTVLFDEIDTVFGPRVKKDNEEIRALLNAGHRRGACSGRCCIKGKQIVTEELPAYCAVALAGLNHLPETIMTRTVVIRMRRRAAGEDVEPYRHRYHAPVGEALARRLEKWATTVKVEIEGYIPAMPAGIIDRDADVWEPLLAISDHAGKAWEYKAHAAACSIVAASKNNAHSLGVLLLSDIRVIFEGIEETPDKMAVIATRRLIERLCDEFPESPWNDIKGKPINPHKLSAILKDYGITSVNIRDGDVYKGYRKQDFHDAWNRYLRTSL
ncbi:DUF3631 domain-containing protein [Sinorhizobium medicae]|nr:DUF3631 domain-containing protein [Sinorhizobium medicae]